MGEGTVAGRLGYLAGTATTRHHCLSWTPLGPLPFGHSCLPLQPHTHRDCASLLYHYHASFALAHVTFSFRHYHCLLTISPSPPLPLRTLSLSHLPPAHPLCCTHLSLPPDAQVASPSLSLSHISLVLYIVPPAPFISPSRDLCHTWIRGVLVTYHALSRVHALAIRVHYHTSLEQPATSLPFLLSRCALSALHCGFACLSCAHLCAAHASWRTRALSSLMEHTDVSLSSSLLLTRTLHILWFCAVCARFGFWLDSPPLYGLRTGFAARLSLYRSTH